MNSAQSTFDTNKICKIRSANKKLIKKALTKKGFTTLFTLQAKAHS